MIVLGQFWDLSSRLSSSPRQRKNNPFHVRHEVDKFVFREYFLVYSCLQNSIFLSQSSANWLNWVLVFSIFSHPCGTDCREGELGTTTGTLLAAHPEVVVGFGAAAFPAERSCSERVTALPGAATEKTSVSQGTERLGWSVPQFIYCTNL